MDKKKLKHPETSKLYFPSSVDKNNLYRSSFHISTPITTASLAFALTTMSSKSSIDNRVGVYHTQMETRELLLKNYYNLFLAVEDELNLPNEFTKLQVIYAPSLPSKVLTKWGLIYVNPELVPVENSLVHSLELREIQLEVLRSIYHLYFGHFTSPYYWNSQWVTLGLARYFCSISKHLTFDTEGEFVVNVVQMVLRKHDASIGKRLGDVPASMDEINYPDLYVVDQRAAAIMRYFANMMGEETFKTAMKEFLVQNRHTSVRHEAFSAHLDQYTTGLRLPADAKLSAITQDYAKNMANRETVKVDQKETYYELFRWTGEFVYMAIDYATPKKPTTGKPKFWGAPFEYVLELHMDIEPWMAVNPQQRGLYTVDYEDDLMANWAKLLSSDEENHGIFNRRQLISDCSNRVHTEFSPLRNYLNLIRYLPKERDRLTWRTVRVTFEDLLLAMRGYNGDLEELYSYFRSLVGDLYLKNRISTGEMENFELTIELAKIACYSKQKECLQDVEEYLKKAREGNGELAGSEDFQEFIYCTMAKDSEKLKEISELAMAMWVKERSVHSNSRNAIRGLACGANKEITRR